MPWGIDKMFLLFFIPFWAVLTGWVFGLTLWGSIHLDFMPAWFLGLHYLLCAAMLIQLFLLIKGARS